MMSRLAIVIFVTALGAGFALSQTGCAGPYSGQPERLKKPKPKKKPADDGEEVASGLDDKCRTNFFDEPTKRRRPADGRNLARQADRILFSAEGQEGPERVGGVVDALGKLSNALAADPYGPEPTYMMAAAYALVGKKGCALRLLERLTELRKHPDVSSEADRIIKRAMHDVRFDPFRDEAETALGN